MKYAKSVSTVIRILIVFNLIGFAVLFLGESVQPFIPQDNGFWMSLSLQAVFCGCCSPAAYRCIQPLRCMRSGC